MQGLETTTIVSAAGAVIVFLGGLVLAGIRAAVAVVKKDIEKLFELQAQLRHDFDILSGEHNSIKESHHGTRRH